MIACGSSGSATDGSPNDLDVIPPQIVSQSPLHRDAEVSVHQPIEVKFSERVRLSDSAPVRLFANTGETDVPVPATVRLSRDGTVVTIEPTAPLSAPADYSVKFGDIRDEAGNALVSMGWTWKAPLWLRVGQPLEDAGDLSSLMIVAGPDEQVTVGSTVTVNVPDQRLLIHAIRRSNDRWTLLDNRLKIDSRIVPSLFWDKELGLSALISDRENHIALEQWLDTKWQEHSLNHSTSDVVDALIGNSKDGERFLAHHVFHMDAGTEIFVSHGSNWSRLGGPANGEDIIQGRLISLFLDRQGTPYVVYPTSSDPGRLRYWSQGSWILRAPPVTSPGDKALLLRITIDDGGTPFALVAISEGPSVYDQRFQIRRFDGNHWIDCGAPLPMPGSSRLQYFGQALDGHTFAVLTTQSPGTEIPDKVLTFDVTQNGWTAIAPPVDTLRQYTRIFATIDDRGAPILAWSEGSVVHLRRLNR
ncbi:Ig-like domain-containing protein [Pendulispora brunnea]|uniref:Ig-like domain-containing protein n=1 Tax=Pendulispora brunnea TaxID=2905690 RepID=A0ABZ2KN67_9BACT